MGFEYKKRQKKGPGYRTPSWQKEKSQTKNIKKIIIRKGIR